MESTQTKANTIPDVEVVRPTGGVAYGKPKDAVPDIDQSMEIMPGAGRTTDQPTQARSGGGTDLSAMYDLFKLQSQQNRMMIDMMRNMAASSNGGTQTDPDLATSATPSAVEGKPTDLDVPLPMRTLRERYIATVGRMYPGGAEQEIGSRKDISNILNQIILMPQSARAAFLLRNPNDMVSPQDYTNLPPQDRQEAALDRLAKYLHHLREPGDLTPEGYDRDKAEARRLLLADGESGEAAESFGVGQPR